jgi:Tfp pilus assembly protein PilN
MYPTRIAELQEKIVRAKRYKCGLSKRAEWLPLPGLAGVNHPVLITCLSLLAPLRFVSCQLAEKNDKQILLIIRRRNLYNVFAKITRFKRDQQTDVRTKNCFPCQGASHYISRLSGNFHLDPL